MNNEASPKAFEVWAIGILGDNPNWRESGDAELAAQAWQASRKQALEEAAVLIESGSFLHDQSPAKLFADQLAPKIRSLK